MGRKVCSMFVLICFVMFALVCFLLEGEKAAATGRTNYDDLVRLFREWRKFQRPKVTDGVPDYTPAAMSEQARRLKGFQKLFNESQAILLNFLKEEEIFTIPDYMVLKPAGHYRLPKVRDYFQHILDRDPLPLQPHDFVGHSPDARRHERDDRPIRGVSRLYFIDGTRAEALATGMEEILMHVGLLDKRPRARELTYNLLTFRAARAISDLKMHSNELTLVEGFQFNIDCTPYGWLPEASPTMWHDIELYMRQPGYGVGYLIGSVQLQKLLADRAIQLGESFALKQFMDEFLAAGMIPIALARWEMTGLENEIRKLW